MVFGDVLPISWPIKVHSSKRLPKQLSVGGFKCNLSVFGFEPIVLQTQNDLTCLPVELSKNKPEA